MCVQIVRSPELSTRGVFVRRSRRFGYIDRRRYRRTDATEMSTNLEPQSAPEMPGLGRLNEVDPAGNLSTQCNGRKGFRGGRGFFFSPTPGISVVLSGCISIVTFSLSTVTISTQPDTTELVGGNTSVAGKLECTGYSDVRVWGDPGRPAPGYREVPGFRDVRISNLAG